MISFCGTTINFSFGDTFNVTFNYSHTNGNPFGLSDYALALPCRVLVEKVAPIGG